MFAMGGTPIAIDIRRAGEGPGKAWAGPAAGLGAEFQETPQNLREAFCLVKVGCAKAGSKLDSVGESCGASVLGNRWNEGQPKKDRHYQPVEDAIAARLGKKTIDANAQLREVRESAMSKQETDRGYRRGQEPSSDAAAQGSERRGALG